MEQHYIDTEWRNWSIGRKNYTVWEVSEWMCMGLWWKILRGENWSR